MRLVKFAERNTKEIVRDPINVFFGLCFPLILLALLSAIQSKIPADTFAIEKLAPAVTVFGYSFIALFSGTLIASDRGTAFLTRLYSSPMTAADFIGGYSLPLLLLAALQSAVCYAAAFIFGLKPSVNLLLAMAVGMPAAVLFIAIGLICGCLLGVKQVGGICGALLTNLTAWLSGAWFELSLIGGVFEDIADLLPFAHAVNAVRAATCGRFSEIMPELWWVIAYAAALSLAAVVIFALKMKVRRAK